MTIVIFFGGLVAGFLIGWIGMALLTMSSLKNQEDDLGENLVYHELTPAHEEGPVSFRQLLTNQQYSGRQLSPATGSSGRGRSQGQDC